MALFGPVDPNVENRRWRINSLVAIHKALPMQDGASRSKNNIQSAGGRMACTFCGFVQTKPRATRRRLPIIPPKVLHLQVLSKANHFAHATQSS